MTREERENALHCLKVMVGEEVCEECKLYGSTGTDHCEADCVRIAIKALEQEPKTGHWIMHENHRECSACKVWLLKDMPRNSYCPNCGAKMESEE